MKRFNIVVNGRAYDVQVDELAPGAAPAAPAPAPAPEPPAPTKEELLLTEIRDLLKEQKK